MLIFWKFFFNFFSLKTQEKIEKRHHMESRSSNQNKENIKTFFHVRVITEMNLLCTNILLQNMYTIVELVKVIKQASLESNEFCPKVKNLIKKMKFLADPTCCQPRYY